MKFTGIRLMSNATHYQKAPNFFLIGAPKCGTTSLASWLSEHQHIFMCEPKEPYFFSTDIQAIRSAETLDEYLGLFSKVGETHLAVGEASTTYLRSCVAVPNILEFQPTAKFIVCLRNPIDMVESVHAQLYQGGRESEADLSRAWSLQGNDRLENIHLEDLLQVARVKRNAPYLGRLVTGADQLAHPSCRPHCSPVFSHRVQEKGHPCRLVGHRKQPTRLPRILDFQSLL